MSTSTWVTLRLAVGAILLAAFAALGVVACGSDNTTGPRGNGGITVDTVVLNNKTYTCVFTNSDGHGGGGGVWCAP